MAPLDVLSNILGTGPSSRLYKALVVTKKASDVGAFIMPTHDPGLFEAMAEVRRDDSLDEARDILIATTEAVGKEGVSDEEVERARQQLLKDRAETESNTSRLAVQLSDWAAQGDWRLWFLYRDRLEQVTADDVKRVAAEYLERSNRTVGLFIPSEKADQTPIPETPDIAKTLADYKGRQQVAAGEAFDASAKSIEEHVTRQDLVGGIKLVVLPKKTRGQTVHMEITLRYGDLNNLKGLATACELLPELMTRGTRQLSRQQIEDQLDRLFCTLHASGEPGKVVFRLQTKHEHLPAVLDLVQQILREPSLPEEEFEILQRETLAQLEQQLTEPQFLAMNRLRRTVSPYPKGDVRYIPTIEEDLARNKAVSLEQLVKLRDGYLGATAGEVAIVGDCEAGGIEEVLAGLFAGWESSQTYERIPRLFFSDVKGGKQQIDTPDKANAMYMAGLAMPMKDSDPDYPALVLGDFVFGGGGLSSRLADRVRQKEGLSYGVGSHFAAESLDARASITLYAIYNPQNVNKVVVAIGEEFDRWLAGGVTQKELDEAKKGWVDDQQIERTKDDRLTHMLSDTAYAGRTMRYYADLEKKVQKLTTDQVLKALKKHIDAKRLSIVVAGDFKKVDKSDEAAGENAAEKPQTKTGAATKAKGKSG
jgi:zinc protease